MPEHTATLTNPPALPPGVLCIDGVTPIALLATEELTRCYEYQIEVMTCALKLAGRPPVAGRVEAARLGVYEHARAMAAVLGGAPHLGHELYASVQRTSLALAIALHEIGQP